MRTPWGTAQTRTPLGTGIVQVTTAGHGGIGLDKARNALVHPAWRNRAGWYEEDCEWAIVAVTFPNLFSAAQLIAAHRCAQNWMPDQYERVLRVRLLPAESGLRQEQIFFRDNANRLLAVAAWGSGQTTGDRERVPDGMVGVVARRGGRRRDDTDERWFLVPAGEYAQRDRFGFLVDEQRHTEWPVRVMA